MDLFLCLAGAENWTVYGSMVQHMVHNKTV